MAFKKNGKSASLGIVSPQDATVKPDKQAAQPQAPEEKKSAKDLEQVTKNDI